MHRAVGLVTSVVAVFTGLVGAGAAAVPAQAATPPALMRPPASLVDTLDAATNFVWVNTLRVAAGAPPVVMQSWAAGVAQAHSLDMANQELLFHNITGYIDQGHTAMNAVFLGENVAEGTNLFYAQGALQASPPHMAILLDPRYNYVGIGAATDASGQVWITEDFAEITGSAPVTKATTAAANPAAPAAQPKPTAPKPAAVTPPKAAVVLPKPAVVATVTTPAAAPSTPPSPAATSPAAPAPSTPAATHAPNSSAASKSHAEEAAPELASHRTQASSGAVLLYGALVLIGVIFALGLGFQVTKLLPTR